MSKVPQEAIAVGVAGAILGGITWRIVGFPVLGTAIGAVSGAVSGARRIYDWNSTRGVGAFVLDHTWALALAIRTTYPYRATLRARHPGLQLVHTAISVVARMRHLRRSNDATF